MAAPDGKSQVTIEYQNERPVAVHTVVVSTQHDESVIDRKKDAISDKAKQRHHRAGHSPGDPQEVLER